MALGRGAQERPGFPKRNARNTKEDATGRPDGQGPLAGTGKQVTSTHFPHKMDKGTHKEGQGRPIEGNRPGMTGHVENRVSGDQPSTRTAKNGIGRGGPLPRTRP